MEQEDKRTKCGTRTDAEKQIYKVKVYGIDYRHIKLMILYFGVSVNYAKLEDIR